MGPMAEGSNEPLRPTPDGENTRIGEGSMGTVVWRKVNSNKLTSLNQVKQHRGQRLPMEDQKG